MKGQIIISLLSRDAITGTGNPGLAIVGPAGEVRGPEEEEATLEQRQSPLPEGWEDRRTPDGRVYYVNHVLKTTQWSRPTQQAIATANGQNGIETPGPSRSSTMKNIEQSPSNGSLNIEVALGSRRHSTENLVGTINGDISNNVDNKAPVISSPCNSVLVPSLAALDIDTNNSTNEEPEGQQPTTTTNSNTARIVSKTTNLSPTQQQQVPPNTTAPMNTLPPPRDAGSRSPPSTNLQLSRIEETSGSQPGTPQRPAEVIQNRNAADGEFLKNTN